jgi:hypothetical protein
MAMLRRYAFILGMTVILVTVRLGTLYADENDLKLIDEVIILPSINNPLFDVPKGHHCIVLSPDGNKILYIRGESAVRPRGYDGYWGGGIYKLVLRDMVTSKDTVLPSASFLTPDYLAKFLSAPIFDCSSTRIVIPAKHEDSNGLAGKDSKIDVMVLNIASGQLHMLHMDSSATYAMFVGDGNVLAVGAIAADRGMLRTFIVDASLDRLVEANDIHGVCLQSARRSDILITGGVKEGGDRDPSTFRLWVYHAFSRSLIGNPAITASISPIRTYSPMLSRDAKFLYYADREQTAITQSATSATIGKIVTRVWSIAEKRQTDLLRDVYPVGPGPRSTMIIAGPGSTLKQNAFVHDPNSGKITKIGGFIGIPVWADSGRMIYYRHGESSDANAYLGTVDSGPG